MTSTYVNVTDAVNTSNFAIPVTYDAAGNVVQLPADVNTLLYPIAPAGIIA
jgi:hypothetical protein